MAGWGFLAGAAKATGNAAASLNSDAVRVAGCPPKRARPHNLMKYLDFLDVHFFESHLQSMNFAMLKLHL